MLLMKDGMHDGLKILGRWVVFIVVLLAATFFAVVVVEGLDVVVGLSDDLRGMIGLAVIVGSFVIFGYIWEKM